MVRKTVTLALYLGFVELVAWFLITSPVHALVSSNTGYVRVASQSAMNALSVAQRSLTLSTVGTAIAGGSATSVAVRFVASAAGWPALGVAAGLVLAQVYYNATQTAAIKAASSPATYPAWPGAILSGPILAGPIIVGSIQKYDIGKHGGGIMGCGIDALPPGWSAIYDSVADTCFVYAPITATNGPGGAILTDPTPTQVQNYLDTLPANDPLSIASNTQTVGVGQTAPDANNQTTVAVDPAAVPTTVVPVGNVSQTDTVVNPNEPQPATTTQTTQQSQTTTTTTTNPDGSTTHTDTDTASVSCDVAGHDQRTFGSILQEHMNTWAGSGIAGQLNLIKNLTWPSTLPVLSLSSSIFGNFTVDFNTWATQFAVLRTLIIAAAGFVAYRIIFVGGAGGSSS